MRKSYYYHDRATAREGGDNAFSRERDIGQSYAGVDGEVIHALLGLLDERVAEDFPAELLGDPADLLQRLVDRHGADRHRGVAQDPFADGVDVSPGREVHDRVGSPA